MPQPRKAPSSLFLEDGRVRASTYYPAEPPCDYIYIISTWLLPAKPVQKHSPAPLRCDLKALKRLNGLRPTAYRRGWTMACERIHERQIQPSIIFSILGAMAAQNNQAA